MRVKWTAAEIADFIAWHTAVAHSAALALQIKELECRRLALEIWLNEYRASLMTEWLYNSLPRQLARRFIKPAQAQLASLGKRIEELKHDRIFR